VPTREALAKAEAAEVDLVEIAPTAQPPVCRIMDFGKFKYREAKKQHEARLKLKQIQVKEVKFRPNTDDGDYQIKLRNLVRFLTEGDKAKVTLRFRGREMAHQEFGVRLLERVRNDLEQVGVVEQFPRMEGRQMVMLIGPKKKPEKAAVPHHQDKQGSGTAAAPATSGSAAPKAPKPKAAGTQAAPAAPVPAATATVTRPGN
jgi:translation initiation factor IF-3